MNKAITDEAVLAGQAVYTPRMLRMYDWWVLGISNRMIWRCPTPRLLAWYNQHVSGCHLDIGVGTGYFLDRCRFPTDRPELALMDMNPNSLSATATRVARYAPQLYQQSAFEPFAVSGRSFDSIGMNYLLHCLPGDMAAKQVLLENASQVLRPGGKLFGSTLLSAGVRRGAIARRLMDLYNRKGFFSNAADSLASLETALASCYTKVEVQTVGCAALFVASNQKH